MIYVQRHCKEAGADEASPSNLNELAARDASITRNDGHIIFNGELIQYFLQYIQGLEQAVYSTIS